MDYAVFVTIVITSYVCLTVWLKRILKARGYEQKQIMGRSQSFIWGLLALVLLFGWFFVNQAEEDEVAKIKTPLEGLAPVFSKILQDEGHARIQLDTLPSDALYQRMSDQMIEWMKLYPFIESVYTIRKLPDGTNVLVVCPEADLNDNGKIDSRLELAVPIGETYPNQLAELELAFKGERTLQETPYTDKWGTWISSFAPIYDSSGNVESVLGIDFDYNEWKVRIAHAQLLHMYFLSVPLILLIGSYWMAFMHRLNGYQIMESQQRYRHLLKQYRGLIDVSPDAIMVHNGKFLFVNEKGLQLIGAETEDQVLGKDVLDIIHPDDKEIILQRIKVIYDTGETQPLQEVKLLTLDNQIRYVEIASIPIKYNDHSAIQVIARDITEKKNMQQALQKSEERFRKIFEKAGIGIGLRKKSGEVIEINPALEKITGFTREQLKHLPISAISEPVQPEDELYEELISGKRDSYQVEKLYYRPDGQVVLGILTVSLFPSEDQTEDYIIGLVVDITEQKEMQKQLRDSEERYRTLVDYSPNAIVVHDGESFLFVNPACVTILGASFHDELIGQPIMERIHPNYRKFSQERLELLQKEAKALDWSEEKFIRMDGTVIDVEVMSTPFIYEGKPVMQTIFRDISEKKKAEEALHKVQEQYRSVVEHVKEVIFQTDEQGHWTFLNPAWEEISGFPIAESLGTSLLAYLHPDDRERNQQLFLPLIEKKQDYCRQEIRLLTRQGGFRWIEVFARLTRDELGQVIGTSGTLNDVTQRKEAEDEIRRSEERFRLLTEYSSDLITLIDGKGKILYASPACEEILQYKAETVVGDDLEKYIHPDDYEMVREHANKMVRDDYSVLTYRVKRNDGEYVWIESSIKLWNKDDQQDIQYISVNRNIHERKLAERKLQEANELLQQLSTIDGLTGVSNRRTFDEKITIEWNRSLRHSSPLSLIMMDIDFFKAYNDTYGHQGGDECLKIVASTIKNSVERSADIVCRYGGEEFVAILPDTDEPGAKQVAENIRAAIEALEIPHIGSKIASYVTLSLGTATMVPIINAQPSDLVEAADKALYHAKQRGRNQVRSYESTFHDESQDNQNRR
ncbi:sensor domain-containing diguanylate cyclase [Brevibacillus sp. SYSU BS000544]|uniref:sensor domain-containing diguanylate cyclase n=1 Tax=Brevibacillus sp. SYSU BS000544 TaxID=3416443 RepID=UPI003CE4C623